MYCNTKVAVQDGNGLNISPFFNSLVGVRQGDNLSPTLFNIFVNDIPKLFDSSCAPASFGNIAIKCLMYADDLIVISESYSGLQNAMDKLEDYCTSWSLRVNVAKTKCMITKGSNAQPCELTYQNDKIEQVNSFKYLGIEFCQDGNTNAARNDLYKRGLKAYFKLVRSLKPLPKPSILLHLFDHLIKPILLYGCEIWSPLDLLYRNAKGPLNEKASFIKDLRDKFPYITKYMDKEDPTEKLHLKCCKLALGVHSKSSNLAVYAELGRYPLFIDQLVQCIKYIEYMELETENVLLKRLYKSVVDGDKQSKLCTLTTLKHQLYKSMGMANLPTNSKKKFYCTLRHKLRTSFGEYWYAYISTTLSITGRQGGNKLRTYKTFKTTINYEPYLQVANPEKRKAIAQFRISSHQLNIETGRFNKKNAYIPPEQRTCKYCSLSKMEDEYHFLMECPRYEPLRLKLLERIMGYNQHFISYSSEEKFFWIMTNECPEIITELGTFLVAGFCQRKQAQSQ